VERDFLPVPSLADGAVYVNDSLDVGLGELQRLVGADEIHQINIGICLAVLIFQNFMKFDPINGHDQMILVGFCECAPEDDGIEESGVKGVCHVAVYVGSFWYLFAHNVLDVD